VPVVLDRVVGARLQQPRDGGPAVGVGVAGLRLEDHRLLPLSEGGFVHGGVQLVVPSAMRVGRGLGGSRMG